MPTPTPPRYYFHNTSYKLYEVLERDATTVHYRAIGNGGARYQLSPAIFARKFGALQAEKMACVEQFRVELETYPLEVNTDLLAKVIAARQSAEPEEKLRLLFADCDAGPGDLVKPKNDFGRVVLEPEAQAEVDATVASILLRREIDAAFDLQAICPVRRSVFCFYGPPGTGKTLTIHAVAAKLGKLLYQVDYGQVQGAESRRAIFTRARRYNAILFLDEADALCAARTFWPSATAQRLNADKNVFIQALDAYDGPVLMATNLLGHFDEAFMRRVNRYIKFNLPDEALRQRIFELHMPAHHSRVLVSFVDAARESDGLSGGDIQNVCFNAIDAACIHVQPDRWEVRTSHVLTEIRKVTQAKRDNLAGEGPRRPQATRQAVGGEE